MRSCNGAQSEAGLLPLDAHYERSLKQSEHTMAEILKDPGYWRDRAEQMRVAAEDSSRFPVERQRLLGVAEQYDRLAVVAEQWSVLDTDLQ
jgi:hypothetical protein